MRNTRARVCLLARSWMFVSGCLRARMNMCVHASTGAGMFVLVYLSLYISVDVCLRDCDMYMISPALQ